MAPIAFLQFLFEQRPLFPFGELLRRRFIRSRRFGVASLGGSAGIGGRFIWLGLTHTADDAFSAIFGQFSIDSYRPDKSTRFAFGTRRKMIPRARFTQDWQRSRTMPSEVAMRCCVWESSWSGLKASSTSIFRPLAAAISVIVVLSRPLFDTGLSSHQRTGITPAAAMVSPTNRNVGMVSLTLR